MAMIFYTDGRPMEEVPDDEGGDAEPQRIVRNVFINCEWSPSDSTPEPTYQTTYEYTFTRRERLRLVLLRWLIQHGKVHERG